MNRLTSPLVSLRHLIAPLAGGVMCSIAPAQITATSGHAVHHPSPPAGSSVVLGAWEHDREIRAFPEVAGVALGANLNIDIAQPGVYSPDAITPGVIEQHTVVSSYFLHGDQIGQDGFRALYGSVTFAEPILGIITSATNLDASDGSLGNPAVTYPATGSEPERGLDTARLDWIKWNDRTLEFYLPVNDWTDQIRVITGTRLAWSIDQGSDTELGDPVADGNEVHDPGDMYLSGAGGAALIFFDDNGNLPVVAPEPPFVTPLPVAGCALGPVAVYPTKADVDGFDQVNLTGLVLHGGIPYEQLHEHQRRGIFEPRYLLLSYDDDNARGWCAPAPPGRLPVEGGAGMPLHGTTAALDEVVELAYPFAGVVPTPVLAEVGVHTALGPNPPAGVQLQDDDVDALDWPVPQCNLPLFSVDHEGSSGGLDPGIIYAATGGAPMVFVTPAMLGLPANGLVDVDAFEFVFMQQPAPGSFALAVLFSVDGNDPGFPGDQSGGLDHRAVYRSFLDGTHDTLVPALNYDIDAIAVQPSLTTSSGGAGAARKENYCDDTVQLHTDGERGAIAVLGSLDVTANDLSLEASHLPSGEPGYFLVSSNQGFIPLPGGSAGNLCLGSPVGRYNAAGMVILGPEGGIALDLTAMPFGLGTSALSGETWNFQCWFRDECTPPVPFCSTSNFTDAASVTFL